jgi:hypothetical protein
MSAIPLRDYPAVQRDPILRVLFEELRAKLRPGDVPMVSTRSSLWDNGEPDRAYRVWVRHVIRRTGQGRRTFGPHRPTLAQAIDGLIAKLR